MSFHNNYYLSGDCYLGMLYLSVKQGSSSIVLDSSL